MKNIVAALATVVLSTSVLNPTLAQTSPRILYYEAEPCGGPTHVLAVNAAGESTIVYTPHASDEILDVAGDGQSGWYAAMNNRGLIKNGQPVATTACSVNNIDVGVTGVAYYSGQDCLGTPHVYRLTGSGASEIVYTPPSLDEILDVAVDGKGNWYASIAFGGSHPKLLKNGAPIPAQVAVVTQLAATAGGSLYYGGDSGAGTSVFLLDSGITVPVFSSPDPFAELKGLAADSQGNWYASFGNGLAPDLVFKNGVPFLVQDCSYGSLDLACEPSGTEWVPIYPGSKLVSDLTEPFKTNVTEFIAALEAGGAAVKIAATYRPPQRAYLMHYAWRVGLEGMDPLLVPPYDGPAPNVAVCWAHHDALGSFDASASKAAASKMVSLFQIGHKPGHKPAFPTTHSLGQAIDMQVTWTGTLAIHAKGASTPTLITSLPQSGLNPELHAIGATYGVIKLVKDPPHWSLFGN